MAQNYSSEVDKIKSTNRALIVALIIAAFFLGSLTNKISYLEKNGSPTPQPTVAQQPGTPPISITKDDIKIWAKDIGLNSNDFNSCLDTEKSKDAIDKDQADGTTGGVSGTPAFFINGILLVGAQPYEAFKTIVEQELAGTTPATSAKVAVNNGHLPPLGEKNAKITIVEFADLECPFCKRFFTDTFPQIKKEYVDTGKAAVYFRHFPLSFHPLALPFANAVECANEQGKFWEMHDKIYNEQG